eukprot:jgi/Mesvir1/19687/Mv09956-RA.1
MGHGNLIAASGPARLSSILTSTRQTGTHEILANPKGRPFSIFIGPAPARSSRPQPWTVSCRSRPLASNPARRTLGARRPLRDFPSPSRLVASVAKTDRMEPSAASPVAPTRPHLGGTSRELAVEHALVWAGLNGLQVVPPNSPNPGAAMHAPVSLLPTPLPRAAYETVLRLAPAFNTIIDRVSADHAFLEQSLSSVAEVDEFTRRLLDILRATKGMARKNARLGIHRSDYMLDAPTGRLLQVELNTISSSFAGLSSKVTEMHRFLSRRLGGDCLPASALPDNPACADIAASLAKAWEVAGRDNGVVLVVVQPGERNIFDQHALTHALFERHGVASIRRTLAQVADTATLDARGDLTIDGHPINVVYYRSGYAPTDYPSEKEWDARLRLEKSSAVICPAIDYHLAGTKKIQQMLALPGVVERYAATPADAAEVRELFAGLWALEGDGDAPAIIEEAMKEPRRFVLKPQREGGGNNTYGDNIPQKLQQLLAPGGEGCAGYILMERIRPPIHPGTFLRNGAVVTCDSLSELGIYSTYLRVDGDVLINKASGHLLRTKSSTSDEGGVATGYAVLDSPFLI